MFYVLLNSVFPKIRGAEYKFLMQWRFIISCQLNDISYYFLLTVLLFLFTLSSSLLLQLLLSPMAARGLTCWHRLNLWLTCTASLNLGVEKNLTCLLKTESQFLGFPAGSPLTWTPKLCVPELLSTENNSYSLLLMKSVILYLSYIFNPQKNNSIIVKYHFTTANFKSATRKNITLCSYVRQSGTMTANYCSQ
jgi:hypothetical protein